MLYLGRGFGLSETEEESNYLPPSQAGFGPIPTYPRYREKRERERCEEIERNESSDERKSKKLGTETRRRGTRTRE